jgi:hypothetical protein
MSKKVVPKYPIYIPSKGRYEKCLTAKFLIEDEVPFWLVVENEEAKEYASRYGKERILILPFSNRGLIYARNWIKQHSIDNGDVRHWQLDDNIVAVYRAYKGARLYCDSGVGLRVCEDFVDRYENVAIAGLNYTMFVLPSGTGCSDRIPPYYLNCHVYSCSLILNSIPYKWRSIYNDDTDLCLQVLAGGWCTVLINAFSAQKKATMTIKGGNTDALYKGDGRLRMAKSLERLWPGVVETKRRFKRPQHVIKNSWRGFDTPLKIKSGIDLSKLPKVDEYGMTLARKASEIKNDRLRKIVKEYNRK